MRLNADILYNHLRRSIPVEITGYKDPSLALQRPEFYDGSGSVFRKHHLYITSGDRISRRTRCEKGAVVLCVGEIPQMSYFTENCCFLWVRQGTDVFTLFNTVQEIWNRYDTWSDSLNYTLAHSASLEEMVDASIAVFQNPILVLDSHFHILAHGGYEGFEGIAEAFESMDSGNLSIHALDEFLKEKEPLYHVREPMLLNIRDTSTLSLNLFEDEEYTGSISVEYRNRPHEPGDIPLLQYFSSFVLAAIRKNSSPSTRKTRSSNSSWIVNTRNSVPKRTNSATISARIWTSWRRRASTRITPNRCTRKRQRWPRPGVNTSVLRLKAK